jgi:hypothetical protein
MGLDSWMGARKHPRNTGLRCQTTGLSPQRNASSCKGHACMQGESLQDKGSGYTKRSEDVDVTTTLEGKGYTPLEIRSSLSLRERPTCT